MAKLPRSTRMWKLVSSAETRRMKCPQTTTALPDSTANDFLKKFMIEVFRTQSNRSPFPRIRRSDSAPLQQWQRADAAHERIRVDDTARSVCVPLAHRRVRPCEHRATRHNRRTLPRATTREGPKSAVDCGAQTLPSRGQSSADDRENRFDALDAFLPAPKNNRQRVQSSPGTSLERTVPPYRTGLDSPRYPLIRSPSSNRRYLQSVRAKSLRRSVHRRRPITQ